MKDNNTHMPVYSERTNKLRAIKKSIIIIIFLLLLIIAFFVSVGMGAVDIPPAEIIKALFIEKQGANYQIIWNVRLPRTLIAALVGICLSLSGVILQGIMRNPLAAPNIIGVSSGGGLVALIVLILLPQYYYLVPIGAFFGALGTTMLIYLLAWQNGVQPMKLILSGVAVSSLLGAGIDSLMVFFPNKVAGVMAFMVGGLSGVTWPQFRLILPYTILGTSIALIFPRKLNILVLGDEVATGLGVNVERTRFAFIILASLLAGSAVSVVGLLGFVGLIVPHTARLIIGSDYRFLFPGTIIFGATTVMLCDTIARLLFAPTEIPVGIIMSILGAPFFLYLLRRQRRGRK